MPSATMRSIARLPRPLSRRALTISTRSSAQSPFGSGPSPPRLPKEEQELFEKLQKQSTGAFSTPREIDPETAPPTPIAKPSIRMQINQSPDSAAEQEPQVRLESGKEMRTGDEFHPNMRRGAPPEFEGDVNPKTGEVGGPKNEPLRWGHVGDWSYNGRVTDF